MLSHAGNHEACTLRTYLSQQHLGHRAAVGVIEMAYGLVGKQETEGLHQRTNHGHTLLLAETHASNQFVTLLSYTKSIKPLVHLPCSTPMGEAVFDLDVFPCRKLWKEPELLKEMAQTRASGLHPLPHREAADVGIIK